METQNHRRSLYKEHKDVILPSQHNQINRQLQQSNRQKKRRELYHSTRKISPSSSPKEEDATDKENEHMETIVVNKTVNTTIIANNSRTAKLICTARDPEKLRKQEAFILRFLEWKEKKKAMLEKQKNQPNVKRPFVSVVCKGTGFGGKNDVASKATVTAGPSATIHQQPSFVPKGHNGFKPPPGLKHPAEMLKEKLKSRQSIYTVVPTPPKKTKRASEAPITRKVLFTNMNGPTLNSHQKKTPSRMTTRKQSKEVVSSGAIMKTTSATPSNSSAKSKMTSSTKPSGTKSVNNLAKAFDKVKSENKKTPITKTTNMTSRSTSNPKPLKMPPPPTVPERRPRIASRIRNLDTAEHKARNDDAKIKPNASSKRVENGKRTNDKKSPKQPHKNARLTQTMKAKKPTKTTKPANGQAGTKIVSLMVNTANENCIGDMLVQTPRDFSNTNQFEDFVTSTKVKNSSQTLEEVNGVSPIQPSTIRSSASAKRNILQDNTIKAIDDKEKSKVEVEKSPKVTSNSRFNFVRYSEINTTINDDYEDEEAAKNIQAAREMALENDQEKETDENITIKADNSLQDDITPTKQKLEDADKPVNYLSPYVSVSRGKVSLKKEKEKRNSIYMASPVVGDADQLNVSQHNDTVKVATPSSPEYSVEVRRTLEAVRYYRKQLQDEIERLHEKCDYWEAYKEENKDMLQAANVDDMIDVAVGQTRLLTSKKFMQFKGLIERCEAGATGIGNRSYDGSEATKFISSTDLEGFWSMLGIQIDNLEKRFINLNRWRDNNWQDPDEVEPKASKPKNLSKIKKKTAAPASKAKPSSVLQQMLRKMQAEMRLKKANDMLANANEFVLTPTRVMDRKYYSPAATIVDIATSTNGRLSLGGRKNSQDSPNRRMSLGGSGVNGHRNSPASPKRHTPFRTSQSNGRKTPGTMTRRATLHESVMRSNAEAQAGFSSPKIQSRKSILKTPGSARTNLRNVVFNQKCRVKKFNFIINDGEDEGDPDESIEEDMKQNVQESDQESENGPTPACGTYTLRNRKVRLRPSSEIVIPK